MATLSLAAPRVLLEDISALIESVHHRTAVMVNSELTLLFWRIGRRIHTEVLAGDRADYGEEIVPTGLIVVTLSRQLSWLHFVGPR